MQLRPHAAALATLAAALVLLALPACRGPHGEAGHGHDHGGQHSFADAERWAEEFDDPARDAWQRPDAVIERAELLPDMVVADIGAGTGYFAVRLARAVPAGKVIGVDIEPDMVRYLNDRADREGLSNLAAILGAPDDPRLPDPVDVVWMVNTYHHLSHRTAYFEKLRGSLSSDGRVVIVDFKMGPRPVGPPERMKVAPEVIIRELADAGYRVVLDDRTLLPHQNLLIFEARVP